MVKSRIKKKVVKCPFCGYTHDHWQQKPDAYLIGTKKGGEVHIHGTWEDKVGSKTIIESAIEECELSDEFASGSHQGKEPPAEVVFRNKQRLGDALVFTAGVRDFKKSFKDTRVNVISTAPHIWDNNPYIDETLLPTEDNIVMVGTKILTNASNRLDWHFTNAYRLSIEDNLGVSIKQGPPKVDIWLTKEEYEAPPVTKDPYWVICIGGEKGWGCKMYPFEKWQEFVSQNPDTLFYQIGTKEDDHPRLQGNNVVDYIGKTQDKDTGIRDLFKLFLNMEGGIGLVSSGMHLASAFNKPYIVVAGAREPRNFTAYPGHQYLSTEGTMACALRACWHCNIDTCTNLVEHPERANSLDRKVPRCVEIVLPEDISNAMAKYYLGGRLSKGRQSPKPPANSINIAKVAKLHKVSRTDVKPTTTVKQKDNISFGGGSLTEQDWVFMESVIDTYKPSSILEFGAGISTLLLNKKCDTVVTYETMEGWITKIKGRNSKCDIRMWDGKTDPGNLPKFDFAFVDGPSGAQNREWSTKLASEHADIIIIHDAGRENERRWQFRYLKDEFVFEARGGNRCHLWVRKDTEYSDIPTNTFKIANKPQQVHLDRIVDTPVPVEPPSKPKPKSKPKTIEVKPRVINPNSKYIKFVFNGRGEGGAERSITWMINTLHEMGHNVTYVTPNEQACGTWRKQGNKDIPVEGVNTLSEACDILVLYANDWIWEFNKPEVREVFENANASRKVMGVNYKVGKIGNADWTTEWDEYLFLNSELEGEVLSKLPKIKTKVMAPPTILDEYLAITPDYNAKNINLVRHSSQGDAKYPRTFNEDLNLIFKCRSDVTVRLMPAPSFIKVFPQYKERFFAHQRNQPSVPEFLAIGNCFWYHLPAGYTEGGPKVVMEAQAAGLPVIGMNSSGMKDRIVTGTGWLCDDIMQQVRVVHNLEAKELEEYGAAAKEHARTQYNPMLWIERILGK